MRPKELPGRGCISPLRFLLAGAIILGIPLRLFGATGPAWWYSSTISASGTAPVISGTANDYAVVNQGMVKNLAVTAINELNAALASVSGSAVGSLPTSLAVTSGSTNDYAVVNLGQLKALAKPFYDCLFAVDYKTGPPWTSDSTLTSGTYPWISHGSANDYAVANIGEVKNLFNFDLTYSSDVNALPNWWRTYYFGTLSVSSTNTVWVSGTEYTYLQAYQQQLNPLPEPPVFTLAAPPDAVLVY